MDSFNDELIQNVLRLEKDTKNGVKLMDYKINEKAVGEGNNISSEVSRLQIHFEKDGKIIKKKYFVKIPSKSPIYVILKQFGIYEKECNIYNIILPEMYKLIDEEEHFSAKTYVTGMSDSKILIMEDLKESGYKMVYRRNQLDFEHSSAALKTLAKFHALSIKINELYPEKMDRVKPDGFYAKGNSVIIEKGFELFVNAMKTLPETEKYYPKLKSLKNEMWNIVLQLTKPKENSLNVLNHGDYWINNFLFKYDKCGNVIQTKIVDFQMCRWCSPAIDILFICISSIRYEVFEKYFDLLLNIYYDALARWMKFLNCEETITMDELKINIEDSYMYGLNVVASILSMVMKKPFEPFVKNDVKNAKPNFEDMNKMYDEEKYRINAAKWVLHYANKGLLQ